MAALDALEAKCDARGTTVTISGMHPDSRRRHGRPAGTLGDGH